MSDKLSKSDKIAAAKKKLKEFQSKQKCESEPQNYLKSEETPQNSSFIGTSLNTQDTVLYPQNYNGFGTAVDFNQTTAIPSNQTNLSAFFDNSIPLGTELNAFDQLRDSQDYNAPQYQNQQREFSATSQMFTSIIPSQQPTSDKNICEFPPIVMTQATDLSQQISENHHNTIEKLNAELVKNNELNIQLSNRNDMIEELQQELHKLQLERSANHEIDKETLKAQLDAHAQTINILVGEKNELTKSLSKYQHSAQSKASEMEELQGRLNASRHRVSVLERDIGNMKSSYERYDYTQQKLCGELEQSEEQIQQLKKIVSNAEEEISELKRSSSLKSERVVILEQELLKKSSELELSKLRVEQLSVGDIMETEGKLESLSKEKLCFEQQIQELEKCIQQLSSERDQSSQEYQNYVQQLNQEIVKLSQQLQECVIDNERLSKRDENLVKHVGDLERQIQQQFNKQKKNHAMSDVSSEELNGLKARCEALEEQKAAYETNQNSNIQQVSALQLQLQEKINIISQLEYAVDRFQCETPDSKNLFASIESDKVAASRAMTQNQDLKLQLDEMQRAYVQLSNDKLELTDRLQSEQHLGREIKLRFESMDSELSSLKEKLHFKDEEMIRLSHENIDLHKQILQLSQELDRLRHFEAKNSSSNVLQQQLIIANEKIKKLRCQVKELEEKDNNVAEIDGVVKPVTGATEKHDQAVEASENYVDSQDTESIGSTLNIATEEAMEKLQERFTRTMTEIANLTEEKHRLEHLVMQLQGETETIGEYITLYQQQRRLLKQRESEKDVQLQQIISDKEIMKDKLDQLNRLVQQLLLQNGECTADVMPSDHFGDNNNSNKMSELIRTDGLASDNVTKNETISKIEIQSTDTASKILHLLSEIQDNNRNQNQNFRKSVSDVHHCACCYGKLEVV